MSRSQVPWLWPLPGVAPVVPRDGPGKFAAVRKHDIHTGVDLYCAPGNLYAQSNPGSSWP